MSTNEDIVQNIKKMAESDTFKALAERNRCDETDTGESEKEIVIQIPAEVYDTPQKVEEKEEPELRKQVEHDEALSFNFREFQYYTLKKIEREHKHCCKFSEMFRDILKAFNEKSSSDYQFRNFTVFLRPAKCEVLHFSFGETVSLKDIKFSKAQVDSRKYTEWGFSFRVGSGEDEGFVVDVVNPSAYSTVMMLDVSFTACQALGIEDEVRDTLGKIGWENICKKVPSLSQEEIVSQISTFINLAIETSEEPIRESNVDEFLMAISAEEAKTE